MPFIQWTPEMSVGVPSLDKDHQRLIEILNHLSLSIRENKSKETLGEIIDNLVAYTLYHFKREEDLFLQTAYPDSAAHVKEHHELKRRIDELKAEHRFGASTELAAKVMAFVTSWLMNHVIGTDKKFTEHFRAHGIS